MNIHKYRNICHLHFESCYYTWSKRLAHNAIPTLHLPGFFVKRQPMAEVTNLAIASTSSGNLKNTTVESSTLGAKEPQQVGTVVTKSDEPQQDNIVKPNCTHSDENKAEIAEKPKIYLKRGASKTTTASKEVLLLKKNIKNEINKSIIYINISINLKKTVVVFFFIFTLKIQVSGLAVMLPIYFKLTELYAVTVYSIQ